MTAPTRAEAVLRVPPDMEKDAPRLPGKARPDNPTAAISRSPAGRSVP